MSIYVFSLVVLGGNFCLAGSWHEKNIVDCGVASNVGTSHPRDDDSKIVGLRGDGYVTDVPILRVVFLLESMY